jgi:hypothetical protein
MNLIIFFFQSVSFQCACSIYENLLSLLHPKKGSITTITQCYGRLIISIVLISQMIDLIYSMISDKEKAKITINKYPTSIGII